MFHSMTYSDLWLSLFVCTCRSQWPRVLRRRSAAARLLRLWVQIPQETWMSVCCRCCLLCVVRKRSLRRADHSSRGVLPTMVCRVWSRNLVNEEAMAHWGAVAPKKKMYVRIYMYVCMYVCTCYVYVYASVYVRTEVGRILPTHTHTHTQKHTNTHAHMYARPCISLYEWLPKSDITVHC